MICSHGDWGLSPTGARASTLENFQVVFQVLPKFCFGPTCPPAGASRFSFQAHLPASRGPVLAQQLTQVRNCSQMNHGSGYQWTAAGPRHCLAWPTQRWWCLKCELDLYEFVLVQTQYALFTPRKYLVRTIFPWYILSTYQYVLCLQKYCRGCSFM